MNKKISLNVCGLWQTEIELDENDTWGDLRGIICAVTGIAHGYQDLEYFNNKHHNEICDLVDGDEITCSYNHNHPLLYHVYFFTHKMHMNVLHSWIASGNDINMQDIDGSTILMNITRKMLKCTIKNEPLNDNYAMSKVSFMKYIKELLRLGSDVKIKDNNGKTIMDHLLEAQNEIDIEDKDKEFIKQCIELIKIF